MSIIAFRCFATRQFLPQKYANAKTLLRYQQGWSAVSTFLSHLNVIASAQVTYQLCTDYPFFRTRPPKELMKARSHNTALTELKVFSAIMQEAVRRGYITANPAMRLGLKRTPAKQKPEITVAEQPTIEDALATRDEWMSDCWLTGQGDQRSWSELTSDSRFSTRGNLARHRSRN